MNGQVVTHYERAAERFVRVQRRAIDCTALDLASELCMDDPLPRLCVVA